MLFHSLIPMVFRSQKPELQNKGHLPLTFQLQKNTLSVLFYYLCKVNAK